MSDDTLSGSDAEVDDFAERALREADADAAGYAAAIGKDAAQAHRRLEERKRQRAEHKEGKGQIEVELTRVAMAHLDSNTKADDGGEDDESNTLSSSSSSSSSSSPSGNEDDQDDPDAMLRAHDKDTERQRHKLMKLKRAQRTRITHP